MERTSPIDRPSTSSVVKPMIFSLVYISYAYTGWNAASYLGGEIGDPGRRLPRSILIGTMGVIALYLGLNTVYALALPAAEIQGIVKERRVQRRGTDRRAGCEASVRREGG